MPEKPYVPPYSVTNTIIHLLAEISDQVTDQVECLMSAIGSETLSAKELLERLGLKHRPTFSNNYLRPALELGLIEMTVPDKPNSSKQQYRAVKRNSD
ncbi:MAG: Fic family protein [Desulfitobacteriaceae bacterium]